MSAFGQVLAAKVEFPTTRTVRLSGTQQIGGGPRTVNINVAARFTRAAQYNAICSGNGIITQETRVRRNATNNRPRRRHIVDGDHKFTRQTTGIARQVMCTGGKAINAVNQIGH